MRKKNLSWTFYKIEIANNPLYIYIYTHDKMTYVTTFSKLQKYQILKSITF